MSSRTTRRSKGSIGPSTVSLSSAIFGLAQIETEWALSLDADYELSEALMHELAELAPPDAVAGFRASFVYRVYGRPLRGTLYPPRTVLYRVRGACYVDEGHGHRVVVPGALDALRGVIYHDDRKPLSRWLASQRRYAEQEADYLLQGDPQTFKRSDRVRRMAWPAPLAVFFYVLICKGCILDGWPGWYYALQRLLAEAMIALELIDRRLRATAPGESPVRGRRRKVRNEPGVLACPRDHTTLTRRSADSLVCAQGHVYPVVEEVPVLLLDDVEQSIDIARASINRAAGREGAIDQRSPELYLESVGINDEEKALVVDLAAHDSAKVDPVVSVLIAATNGIAYKSLVGKLSEYPIPELRLPAGQGKCAGHRMQLGAVVDRGGAKRAIASSVSIRRWAH